MPKLIRRIRQFVRRFVRRTPTATAKVVDRAPTAPTAPTAPPTNPPSPKLAKLSHGEAWGFGYYQALDDFHKLSRIERQAPPDDVDDRVGTFGNLAGPDQLVNVKEAFRRGYMQSWGDAQLMDAKYDDAEQFLNPKRYPILEPHGDSVDCWIGDELWCALERAYASDGASIVDRLPGVHAACSADEVSPIAVTWALPNGFYFEPRPGIEKRNEYGVREIGTVLDSNPYADRYALCEAGGKTFSSIGEAATSGLGKVTIFSPSPNPNPYGETRPDEQSEHERCHKPIGRKVEDASDPGDGYYEYRNATADNPAGYWWIEPGDNAERYCGATREEVREALLSWWNDVWAQSFPETETLPVRERHQVVQPRPYLGNWFMSKAGWERLAETLRAHVRNNLPDYVLAVTADNMVDDAVTALWETIYHGIDEDIVEALPPGWAWKADPVPSVTPNGRPIYGTLIEYGEPDKAFAVVVEWPNGETSNPYGETAAREAITPEPACTCDTCVNFEDFVPAVALVRLDDGTEYDVCADCLDRGAWMKTLWTIAIRGRIARLCMVDRLGVPMRF